MKSLGIIIVDHGSRRDESNRMLEEVAGRSLEELVSQRDELLMGLLQLLADAGGDTRRRVDGSIPEARRE